MTKPSILVADDEQAARFGIAKALSKLGCDVLEARDGAEALALIQQRAPVLVFADLNMPVLSGEQLLERLGSAGLAEVEVVVVTANDTVQKAVTCMRLGASDYVTKPFEVEHLRAIARRAIERRGLRQRVSELQRQLDNTRAFGALVGVSRAMETLFSQMERAAKAPLDVLVVGETGTGKELIARELHRLSPRAQGPFVAVNASAIQPTLAESELFGHVKGAFTGADAPRKGVFEQASTGTLFLDEIGDMPLDLQAKVLRVLQQRTLQPVGSSKEVSVDVRVICATHQDLAAAIAEGAFREDLFYRIKGIRLEAPALRTRPQDIVLLAEYFVQKYCSDNGCEAPALSADAVERLLAYPWPGNVRELQQVITAAVSMRAGRDIEAADLDLTTPPGCAAVPQPEMSGLLGLPLTEAKQKLVTWLERTAIEAALSACDGNVSAAARRLGIHRQSLQQKMGQLGLRSDR